MKRNLHSVGSPIILLLALCASPLCAATIVLQDNRSYTLADHLEILIDPSGHLNFAEILSPRFNNEFKPIQGDIRRGYSADSVWVRFELRRLAPFPKDSYLSLAPPTLDFVNVYVQDGENANAPSSYIEYHTGDHAPATSRPLIHPNFVIPLSLPSNRPVMVYVGLQSSSLMNLTGEIDPFADFVYQTARIILLQAGWLAVALIISLISLQFYLKLRDPLFGYYTLYILALLTNRISSNGLLPMILPGQAHLLADYFISAGSCLAAVFMCCFCIRLFGKVAGLWMLRCLKLILLLAVLSVLCIPFVRWGMISLPMYVVTILLLCLSSRLSFSLARQGEGGGWLYFFAFSSYGIVCAIAFLRSSGLPTVGWLSVNALQIGSLVHIVFLTMALAERLHWVERKALAVERNAKQAAIKMAAEMTVELREKQYELQKLLERQLRFVSMVSHDYRNPLAIIRSNLGLLAKLKDDPEGNLSFALGKMNRAVSRLLEVLELSLDKVRLGEDTFEDAVKVMRESMPLSPFMSSIIEQAADFWPKHQFVLASSNAVSINIVADWKLLKTALLNLLDNAVKYSPEGTRVDIGFAQSGHELIISVSDQGRGIPPQERDQVFKKYYRCRGIGKITGSGLGLYLVARIAEEHQGSVTIADAKDGGTLVTLRLPLS